MGHVLIVGKTTYKSLPSLKGRTVLYLSRTENHENYFNSLDKALEFAKNKYPQKPMILRHQRPIFFVALNYIIDQSKYFMNVGIVGLGKMGLLHTAILNTFDDNGVDVCYEVHPVEDIHDGDTFERFLEATGNHKRVNILYDPSHFVLQQLDYLKYIDHYHQFIKAFHVKDAEFNSSGKKGTFGGYNDWKNRAGRYRSPGDGQVDFKQVFSKLTEYGCDVWAVLEWECVIKSPAQGAREGVAFIKNHLIETTNKKFDDFAGSDGTKNEDQLKKIIGI